MCVGGEENGKPVRERKDKIKERREGKNKDREREKCPKRMKLEKL